MKYHSLKSSGICVVVNNLSTLPSVEPKTAMDVFNFWKSPLQPRWESLNCPLSFTTNLTNLDVFELLNKSGL